MSERITGAALVTVAAVAFSAKAVIIKLAYRHGVDPLTLLTLRMLISAPFFLAHGLWSARGAVEPLTIPDWRAVVILGLMGYYLASLFDFIGLQYISAALERLVLFLYPTFVLLLAALIFKRRVTRRDLMALGLCYGGIVLVLANDDRRRGAGGDDPPRLLVPRRGHHRDPARGRGAGAGGGARHLVPENDGKLVCVNRLSLI